MEQMRETRAMDAEDTQQVDLWQRQLGLRAYRGFSSENPTGQQVVMGDVALVYTTADMNQSLVNEPMLPIEEFSK